ncbi:MAG: hypothetical protein CBC12_03030 [Candidatus Puniceispirillum sp. TMED52]|nr:hypothetical protein [SAR116 cluster bacterium]OUU53037.1 MAG: hypothetical protein CBC12_03030 [Candidatus Puniceispirillum sp. TMED52]HCP17730.1 hypothetical protein [Alphaproteobacteria bacterium]|tara:strand:+ start:556 stop:771 length:216 start_codon:yes stop_codon:yes gene_type:complete
MSIQTIIKTANDEFCRFSGITALNRKMRINRIMSSLEQLDNRTLNDIGISRWQIKDRARQIVDNDNTKSAA